MRIAKTTLPKLPPRTDYRAKLWPHGEFASWKVRRIPSLGNLKVKRVGSTGGLGGSPIYGFINYAEKSQDAETKAATRNWGLTSYMRKLLRSAGEVLERKHGKYNMAFITVTMPYSHPNDVKRFLLEWSEIQRRFVQEITRQLIRHSVSPEIAWVTELQGKRGQVYGYPCPHMHLLVAGRLPGHAWALHKDWVRQAWYRIVKDCCQKDFDPSAATRIESVKKSCAAYMTKYVTKATAAESKLWEGTEWEVYLPDRWGRVTNTLRKDVLEAIEMLTGEGGLALSFDLPELQEAGQVYLVFSEYGCTSGFVLDKAAFNDAWQYYRSVDAAYWEHREELSHHQHSIFINERNHEPGAKG